MGITIRKKIVVPMLNIPRFRIAPVTAAPWLRASKRVSQKFTTNEGASETATAADIICHRPNSSMVSCLVMRIVKARPVKRLRNLDRKTMNPEYLSRILLNIIR